MKMFTPPNHIGFEALKLFGENEKIIDGSLAYIQPGGGGPIELHTHAHDHLFAVVEGEAKILLDKEVVVIKKGESFLVDGRIPHSVWNNCQNQTVMIGINVNKCVKSE
ncbi:MAG: cupin domain-containing protein [Clostridia bacterium]|nr:cupin domain-containing protein [Clostridia bacterium]